MNHHFIPWSVRVSKRVVDISVASSALVLLAVPMVVIALMIRLDSPGPVLFRQTRLGRSQAGHISTFKMLKFRSMRQDAEARTGPVWAKANDPRVTRVGRLLRATRLDELPQLINVLRGEMSLIGPRPERPEIAESLERDIPFFGERAFEVKPGITGLAQIKQNYDSCLEDVRQKLVWDHTYALQLISVRTWLTADLNIAFATLSVMINRRGQ